MEHLLSADTLIALVTLSLMEIVLGIDNIIFISILAGKLPSAAQNKARRLGLLLALVTRLGLLFSITAVMRLTHPFFTVFGKAFSGRDLILLIGGLFLLGKSTHEIYDKLEAEHAEVKIPKASAFLFVLVQIAVLDIVFSLDSVITAVGMAQALWVMVVAMLVAVGVMLIFADAIGQFVERHPSVKILALSFLLLIGVLLVAEGMGQHIDKGYIYFAMAFSLFVELLNIRLRKTRKPVDLHQRFEKN